MKNLFKFFNNEPQKIDTTKAVTLHKDNEKTAIRKGEIGEYKIDIQLDQLPKEYKHLSDLLVVNTKSKSGYSQIDHVIITPFGIFVIETKNYQGTIYAGKERKTWSVNGKIKMMNPFLQNYGHIQALKSYIDSKYHHTFISIVSFTKRATFKLDEMDLRQISSNDLIVYDVELSDYIHRKISVQKIRHKEPLISNAKIESIYHSLQEVNILDPNTRELHVRLLKGEEDNSTESTKQAKCTICKKPVSEKVKAFCLSNKKFNGRIYCFEHQGK